MCCVEIGQDSEGGRQKTGVLVFWVFCEQGSKYVMRTTRAKSSLHQAANLTAQEEESF